MRKSTLRAVIALFLVAILAAAAWFTGWRITGVMNPLNWGKGNQVVEPETPNDNDNSTAMDNSVSTVQKLDKDTIAVTSDGEQLKAGGSYVMPTSFMFVNSRSVIPTEPAPNGEITLTAILSNVYVVGEFDWSVNFAESLDSVDEYVTVTPNEENSSEAVVKYLSNFNDTIIITATLRDDTSVTASCTVDCLRDFYLTSLMLGPTDFDDILDFECRVTWSDGTTEGNFALKSATLSISDDFISLVKKRLNFIPTFKMYHFDADNVDINLSSDYLCVSSGYVTEYSDFIDGFDDYDDAHKEAIYWAWYNANYDYGEAFHVYIDVEYSYQYAGVEFTTIVENDYLCGYLNGYNYGFDITFNSSLNHNVMF